MDLPEGFTDTPPPTAAPPPNTAAGEPNPLPEGFSAAPPLPAGFSYEPPKPEPPPGFTYDNPVNPATGDPKQVPNTAVPGFWSAVGSAYTKGFTQNVADAVAGSKVLLPPNLGGQTLEEQAQAAQNAPQTQDEIDKLVQQGLFTGWSDPKWWGTHIAHGVGGMTPGLAAGAAGGVAFGAPGAIGGFALESGISQLVPAYKAARAAGLSPEDATTRALVDSGISAAAATLMGVAPGVSVFGRDAVTTAFRRPVMEALTQLGIVQPLIGDTQHLVTSLTHHEVPGTEEMLTTHVDQMAMGGVMVGAHSAVRAFAKPAETLPPAGPEVVQQSFENQAPKVGPEPTPPPPVAGSTIEGEVPQTDMSASMAPPGGEMEETLYPREHKIFFSPLLKAARERLPENATPEQAIATLRNTPGVKEEEIVDIGLPAYLASVDGKVNKADLIAHLEANSLIVEEARAEEPLVTKLARDSAEAENGRGSWERIGGGGQEHYLRDARRVILRPFGEFQQALEEKYGHNLNLWPQDVIDRLEAKRAEVNRQLEQERAHEYPNSVLPGEHSNYREFVLKVPRIAEPVLPELAGRPRGWSYAEGNNTGNNYVSSHWPHDVNPFAHFRTTDRMDRDGRHLLHVEEIQSDVHQKGRKEGYRSSSVSFDEASRKLRAENDRFDNFLYERRVHSKEALEDVERRHYDDPEFLQLQEERKPIWEEYKRALDEQSKLPNLPFKTAWEELAVKRILRLAADEGYDGVSWTTGDQVGLRLSEPEQMRGNREFYDKKISKIFKKWADKIGMDVGTTKLDGVVSDPYLLRPVHIARTLRNLHDAMGFDAKLAVEAHNNFVEMNPAAGSRIRQGLPLYDEGVKRNRTLSEALVQGDPEGMKGPGAKLAQFIGKIAKDMKISREIVFDIRPRAEEWRGNADVENGKYKISINTRLLRTAEDMYATMAHELGHIIYWDKFATASNELKVQIFEAFRQYKAGIAGARLVGDVRKARDNAISEMTGARNPVDPLSGRQNYIPLSDLMPRSREYLVSFKEWFAEQTAKWATSSEKPLTRMDKFFAEVGKQIRALLERFANIRKSPATAEKVIQDWFDAMLETPDGFGADIKDQMEFDTKRMNQAALDADGTPQVSPTPMSTSTIGGRRIIDTLPPDAKAAGRAAAAHGDRMNRFFEWMTSLPQIAEMNKHIRGLTLYKEIVSLMNVEKNTIMGAASETLRAWKGIRDPKQLFALGRFIEDYMNGMFKDPSDMTGTVRRPTAKEFSDLAAKHKMSKQALDIFNRLVRDFDGTLEKYRQLLLEDAVKISDPIRQSQAIDDINRQVDSLLRRPYFPAMRFGKYTITVYDTKKNVRHFEQTESLRKQRLIKAALEKSPDLLPGDEVRSGMVFKDAAPLLGMPPGLLDLMANKLSLSDTQKAMLDQLRFDYAPSQSFRHQFKTRDLTPGYSTDFQRAYAHFFFHGANHITRVKWVDALRDQIREVKKTSVELLEANKRDQIANYMTQHMNMLVDPKPDFAALRGLMFHWFLGFNPASATLNLSQTALMTFPHLASKFGGVGIGDLRAIGALARASTDLNNFYKKGNLVEAAKAAPEGAAGAKMRALGEAVREGVISETQAHTLAAVSENRNLLRAFGSKGEEAWQNFSEASSWMFEMTEQYNRRVAFRAAWDLAMRDPNNKYVSETIRDNPLQYQRLRDQNWSHQEAAAFTAAKHTTEATQFVYAPYSRPKFMWGRKGALFIFKSFVQNTLFNLYNNPAGAARTLLILGAVGGLMGLPGTEDVNGILKALGWRLFGKDWDVEDEGRKFAVDVLHGVIGPDMLLHGMSTKGFGIPHVLNAIGASVGLPKIVPTLDRHGSIGMGNILPFEPGKLFGPAKDVKTNELVQLQRASGAGFSNIFALYNFLTSQQDIGSLKRWEGIMPRVMSNISHAFRYYKNGEETNSAGIPIVKFDPNDTEQMAEILARGMGYQPRRLIARYEQIQAQQEAATYWDLRKQILLRQFSTALKGQDPEEKTRVLQSIRNYNQELPQEARAKAISGQVLRESVMSRARNTAKQEAGLPTSKQNTEMFRAMDKYFPEGKPTGMVGVTPVK